MRMFATMFSADPPVIYWLPQSLQVIHLAQNLTSQGHGVWETMDAGPQVKLITLADSLPAILAELEKQLPGIDPVVCSPGPGLEFPDV
jgi:diphosphomevalonate decarboxylase